MVGCNVALYVALWGNVEGNCSYREINPEAIIWIED